MQFSSGPLPTTCGWIQQRQDKPYCQVGDYNDCHAEAIEEDILQEGVPDTVQTNGDSSFDGSSLGVLSIGGHMQKCDKDQEREGVTVMNDPRTRFGRIVKPPQRFEFLVETIDKNDDDCDNANHLSDVDPYTGSSHLSEFPEILQRHRLALLAQD